MNIRTGEHRELGNKDRETLLGNIRSGEHMNRQRILGTKTLNGAYRDWENFEKGLGDHCGEHRGGGIWSREQGYWGIVFEEQ